MPKFLIESPRIRLCVVLMLTILIGIFSSIFSTQIMPDGKLDLSLIPKASSIWPLLLTGLLWIYIQIMLVRDEEDALKYINNDYCLGFLRRIKLDGLARLAKTDPEKASLIDVKQVFDSIEVQRK